MKIKRKSFIKSSSDTAKYIEDDEDDYEEPKKWYEEIQEDPKNYDKKHTEQILIELKDEAKKCHDAEVLNYNTKMSKSDNNYKWMKNVMSKGTLSDKIAAHTVTIQNNPVTNLDTIRNLVGMVKVGKKKECTSVMETLTELFISNLLISHRKLKAFHQRPLLSLNDLSSGNAVTRRKLLSYWYFEDQLKEVYASFVLSLNAIAHDSVEANKDKAITAMYKLLSENAEQEKNLLTYLVNKLGDPSQKIASKVIYCLTQLLYKHVNMQLVVLNEIEKLLFRPNVSKRAQYYSLCFLSQYHLNHEASDVARRLIEVYFSFFKACVKTGDVDSRMMSALLMGLNRAYPYAKVEINKIQQHIDTLYRLVHMGNFNISLHTLNLLYQVSDGENGVSDRYYGALYRKLLDPNLLNTTHRAILLSLIYKALLKDKEINRIKVFIKRLLQISQYTTACFSCGILYLISQLMHKKRGLEACVLKRAVPEGFEDDDQEEKYKDVKDDTEIKEEIIETLNEDEITKITEPIETEDIKPNLDEIAPTLGWYHCSNDNKSSNSRKYDPLARNPLYGGGEYCVYMELLNLRNHYHPTVSLFATNLIEGEKIVYNGDPLNDFTVIRFLDRFVFKNPKKIEESGKDPTFGKRKLYRPKGMKGVSVKSGVYAKEDAKNIPVDELFLHTYLQQKYKDKGNVEDDDDSDLESVQSEEFEEMLDKLAGAKDNEDENEELDYMNEIGSNLKQNKNKRNKTDEVNDEEDEEQFSDEDNDDLDEDNDDLDMNDDDEELLNDLSEDDDEDIEFSDEDDGDKKKKGKKGDIMSNFVAAEEFAELLEEEGSSKIKPGGSNIYANKDNADVKQLSWEESRNRWLNGFNKTVGGKKSKKFNRNFAKKRVNNSKISNKNKKVKR